MSNLFGVVNRPMFDTNMFSINQPVYVEDYKKSLEYPGIITFIDPMFIDLLCYDSEDAKGVFLRVYIDAFVDGLYELKGLIKADLKEVFEKNNPSTVENKDNLDDSSLTEPLDNISTEPSDIECNKANASSNVEVNEDINVEGSDVDRCNNVMDPCLNSSDSFIKISEDRELINK